jgi:hypothetical protein
MTSLLTLKLKSSLMKKLLAFVFAGMLALTFLTANAQEQPLGKHEISAGYGFISAAEIADEFPNILEKIIGIDSIQSASGPNYGTLSIEYQRSLGKVLSLGFTFSANPIQSNLTFKKGTTAIAYALAITLMPKLKATYVQHGIFSAYSTVAIGLAYVAKETDYANGTIEKSTKWRLGYQIGLIGVRVGRNVAGFVELGYGYEGVVRLGLSAKL